LVGRKETGGLDISRICNFTIKKEQEFAGIHPASLSPEEGEARTKSKEIRNAK